MFKKWKTKQFGRKAGMNISKDNMQMQNYTFQNSVMPGNLNFKRRQILIPSMRY